MGYCPIQRVDVVECPCPTQSSHPEAMVGAGSTMTQFSLEVGLLVGTGQARRDLSEAFCVWLLADIFSVPVACGQPVGRKVWALGGHLHHWAEDHSWKALGQVEGMWESAP